MQARYKDRAAPCSEKQGPLGSTYQNLEGQRHMEGHTEAIILYQEHCQLHT